MCVCVCVSSIAMVFLPLSSIEKWLSLHTHKQGCLEELIDYEERQYDIIGPIGIAFGVFQVCSSEPVRGSQPGTAHQTLCLSR